MRLALLILVAVGFSLSAIAARAASPEEQLIGVLSSKASAVEKNKACRELKLVGTEKSVSALAALLLDPDLSHPARIALESMPYPAAGAALREAAGKATGLIRSGLIDSLGERRDPEAVKVIAPALEDSDKEVVAAAAWALGKIGTTDAAAAMQAACEKAATERPVIGLGLVLCARNLLKSGKPNEARKIFETLVQRFDDGPQEAKDVGLMWNDKHVRAAALAGEARAWSADVQAERAIHHLEWAFDDPRRAAAAGLLPELSVTGLLSATGHMNQQPIASQVALLSAIRIRGDRRLAPVALGALDSSDGQVCLAAARALGSVGDTSALPKLLLAMGKGGQVADAAQKSIESLGGKDIDKMVFDALRGEKDPKRRAEWIDVVLARRAAGAVNVLLGEAEFSDPIVRGRAMVALAQLAAPRDLPGLIGGVLAAQVGPEREAAERSVVRVMAQVKEPQERTAAVVAAIAAAGNPPDLLPLAGRFGNQSVLSAVLTAIGSQDSRIHEAGLRALCNWPDATVAEQLFKLAEISAVPAERAMALRAYTRVVSLPKQGGDADRLARLKRAMSIAQHDDLRAYILERAAAVRTVEALRFVLPYVDQPALAETACKSVAELAHHRELRDPNKAEFRAALEKVQHTCQDRLVLEQVKRYLDAMRVE